MFWNKKDEKTGDQSGGLATVFGLRPVVARTEKPLVIHQGLIGRENSGKSLTLRMLYKGPMQGSLPSGLQLDVDGPLNTAKLVKVIEETIGGLEHQGLASTLDPEWIEYNLYEAEHPRARFRIKEVVGQILTNTQPDSSAEQKAKYQEYVDHLSRVDVLWVMLPCPPQQSTPRDIERFERDLRITCAYLREALKLRSTRQPLAVAVTITKIDALFASEEEARQQLPDAGLVKVLSPLVGMLKASDKVAEAAVFTTSSLGFGRAMVRETDTPLDGDADASAQSSNGARSGSPNGELEWILRPGTSPAPFNLTPLVVWSLLCGMLHQRVEPVGDAEPAAVRVGRMLSGDLDAIGGWYVPLKGRLLPKS